MQTKDKVKSKLESLKKEDSKYLTGNTLTKEDIIDGLQSKSNPKILDSLKRLLALSILGKSLTKFTSKIIAQLANPDIEIKRLSYYLLSQISYEQPDCDELLMCISPLHKTMTSNGVTSVTKGDTLRTLASLSINEMRPMLIATLQRLHVDKSPYVKKIAALNLLALHASQPDEVEAEDVSAFFKFLLRDSICLRSAVMHLQRVMDVKNNLDFLHFHFRKLCSELHTYPVHDIVPLLSLLHKYARIYLKHAPLNAITDASAAPSSKTSAAVVSLKQSKPSLPSKSTMHSDLALLLKTCNRLLFSIHPSIIIEVAHIAAEFPTADIMTKTAKALLRFVNISSDSKYIVLQTIEAIASRHPQYFRTSFRTLYVTQFEKAYCKKKKIEILMHLVDDSNVLAVLEELNYQVRSANVDISVAAISCVQNIALKHPTKYFGRCIKSLTTLLKSSSGIFIDTLVNAICDLIQQDIKQYYPILTYVFRYISGVRDELVREKIIGQIVHSCDEIPTICTEYYRILLSGYRSENEIVKLQIGRLGYKLTKVMDSNEKVYESLLKLFEFNLKLGTSDISFKVRDSIRFISALASGQEKQFPVDFSSTKAGVSEVQNKDSEEVNPIAVNEQQEQVKSNNELTSILVTADGFRIGSLSSLVGSKVRGYDDFEVAEVCRDSTDDRRSEMEIQVANEKVQLAAERANRDKVREQTASTTQPVGAAVTGPAAGVRDQPTANTVNKAQTKQVQNDLLNHYQDTLEKTLNDFFED